MAIARDIPKCPFCGKIIAKAIYQNYHDLPMSMRPIGDDFIRWEMKECHCKGAKAARAKLKKDQKNFWEDILQGKTLKEWLESKPQNKIRK